MLKKTITYTDCNGEKREEDFYFHFSRAEILEKELSVEGGLGAMLRRIINAQDMPSLMKLFKELVLDAYGEKSPDGKRFIKSEELKTAFAQTEAYSILFTKLATDDEAAAEFFNALIPEEPEQKKPDVE